jgi:hypothetical protein
MILAVPKTQDYSPQSSEAVGISTSGGTLARPTVSHIRRILLDAVRLCDTIFAYGGELMAKTPRSPVPQVAAVPFSPDLSGPSEFRTILSNQERESEYKLDDNTILRIRPVLIEARRLTNQWAPDGDPVYVTKVGFAISTQAPAHLRRGAPIKKARNPAKTKVRRSKGKAS